MVGSPLTLGQYLRHLRLERQLSIAKIAAHTGLSANAIRWMERGVTQPKPESLKALAEALGVTYEELLFRAGYLDRVEITDEDRELMRLLRSLSAESRRVLLEILRVIEQMHGVSEEEKHVWEGHSATPPLIDILPIGT